MLMWNAVEGLPSHLILLMWWSICRAHLKHFIMVPWWILGCALIYLLWQGGWGADYLRSQLESRWSGQVPGVVYGGGGWKVRFDLDNVWYYKSLVEVVMSMFILVCADVHHFLLLFFLSLSSLLSWWSVHAFLSGDYSLGWCLMVDSTGRSIGNNYRCKDDVVITYLTDRFPRGGLVDFLTF